MLQKTKHVAELSRCRDTQNMCCLPSSACTMYCTYEYVQCTSIYMYHCTLYIYTMQSVCEVVSVIYFEIYRTGFQYGKI